MVLGFPRFSLILTANDISVSADLVISKSTGGCDSGSSILPTLPSLALPTLPLPNLDSLASIYDRNSATQGPALETEGAYIDRQIIYMLSSIENDQPTQKPCILLNSEYPTSVKISDLVGTVVEQQLRKCDPSTSSLLST